MTVCAIEKFLNECHQGSSQKVSYNITCLIGLVIFLDMNIFLQLLKLDNDDGRVEYPEVDANQLEMLEPIEPAVRQRKHPPQYSDRAESVSSLTSLESAAGDVDKVVSFNVLFFEY